MQSSFSPIRSAEKTYYEERTVSEMTFDCFEPENMFAKCDTKSGKYLACSLAFRGDIVPKNIGIAFSKLKLDKTIDFLDWRPSNYRIRLDYNLPTAVPGGDLAKTTRDICMISNTTAIVEVFKRFRRQFDEMYSKQELLNEYLADGMEGAQFLEAR